MQGDLDTFDRKILGVLQEDASLSSGDIAQRVGLSQSPCWRRLDRLEKDGYVLRRVAILNRKLLGLDFTVMTHIKIDYSKREANGNIAQRLCEFPEVVECYVAIGSVDIIAKLILGSLEEFQEFILKKLSAIKGIVDITSYVLMKEEKNTSALPLAR